LTYYGLDLYKKRNLSELLARLADVEGIEWIRLQYAYPAGFPLDVLDVMREHSTICNYLDMPLQHGSSEILRLMRRGITREKTEALIDTIRDKVPGIALRTTLISGHPGETEVHFDEMYEFVEKMRFDRLGIMALQEGISFELNQQKIGNTYKVLFDRKEGGYYVGRTEFDSPEVDNEVLVDATKHFVRLGGFTAVNIIEATEFDLYAEPVR
jgi:ribosomal protein S12 methylthiotransferase